MHGKASSKIMATLTLPQIGHANVLLTRAMDRYRCDGGYAEVRGETSSGRPQRNAGLLVDGARSLLATRTKTAGLEYHLKPWKPALSRAAVNTRVIHLSSKNPVHGFSVNSYRAGAPSSMLS